MNAIESSTKLKLLALIKEFGQTDTAKIRYFVQSLLAVQTVAFP